MKTTVIYHSADYDGIFCREIARKFLPEAELIGWNFGDRQVPMPAEGAVYILDLSPECLADNPQIQGRVWNRMVWIDHHKTSIEKWPEAIQGHRIDGVAACRLAWQWFAAARLAGDTALPGKAAFVNRTVIEPLAVRLAGEYDVWDHRDPDALTLQFGLRFVEQGADFWEALLQADGVGEKAVQDLVEHGRIAQRYQQKIDADLVKHRSFGMTWEGLNWVVLNTGRCNSLTFAAVDCPETGHDALLGYMFNGKAWTVSLFRARHRMDLDLSVLAKKHGGGGHAGACGFTSEKWPF